MTPLINLSLAEQTSHEFRTPLNAIIGFTGTLLMKLAGPINTDQEKQLRIIQDSARQLLRLINGLIDKAPVLSGEILHSDSASIVESQPESPRSKIVGKTRILYIDDDPNSRKLVVFLLDAFGHEALIAEDGEKGLAIARLELPDLILCDLQLPGLNGYEVALELKRDPALAHIPLVAVTAIAPIDSHDAFPRGSFDYVLVKPIRAERLAAQLQCFLTGTANLLGLSKIDGKK